MKATMTVTALGVAALAALSSPTHADTDTPQARITRSADGFEAARGGARVRDPGALVESASVPRPARATLKGGDSRVAAVSGGEAWVYDAFTELFDDLDGDGYYTYIRVRFDVDSIYADHYVYARLFISEDGTHWDEYHATGDFLVEGSSPLDDYEVETELVGGFPTGLYDVLIEIYDADLGDFLADFGPADSSALSLLPLEEVGLDPSPPVIVVSDEHGGGGASGWLTLFALALLLIVTSRTRNAPALVRARTRPSHCPRRSARAHAQTTAGCR